MCQQEEFEDRVSPSPYIWKREIFSAPSTPLLPSYDWSGRPVPRALPIPRYLKSPKTSHQLCEWAAIPTSTFRSTISSSSSSSEEQQQQRLMTAHRANDGVCAIDAHNATLPNCPALEVTLCGDGLDTETETQTTASSTDNGVDSKEDNVLANIIDRQDQGEENHRPRSPFQTSAETLAAIDDRPRFRHRGYSDMAVPYYDPLPLRLAGTGPGTTPTPTVRGLGRFPRPPLPTPSEVPVDIRIRGLDPVQLSVVRQARPSFSVQNIPRPCAPLQSSEEVLATLYDRKIDPALLAAANCVISAPGQFGQPARVHWSPPFDGSDLDSEPYECPGLTAELLKDFLHEWENVKPCGCWRITGPFTHPRGKEASILRFGPVEVMVSGVMDKENRVNCDERLPIFIGDYDIKVFLEECASVLEFHEADSDTATSNNNPPIVNSTFLSTFKDEKIVRIHARAASRPPSEGALGASHQLELGDLLQELQHPFVPITLIIAYNRDFDDDMEDDSDLKLVPISPTLSPQDTHDGDNNSDRTWTSTPTLSIDEGSSSSSEGELTLSEQDAINDLGDLLIGDLDISDISGNDDDDEEEVHYAPGDLRRMPSLLANLDNLDDTAWNRIYIEHAYMDRREVQALHRHQQQQQGREEEEGEEAVYHDALRGEEEGVDSSSTPPPPYVPNAEDFRVSDDVW